MDEIYELTVEVSEYNFRVDTVAKLLMNISYWIRKNNEHPEEEAYPGHYKKSLEEQWTKLQRPELKQIIHEIEKMETLYELLYDEYYFRFLKDSPTSKV